MQRIGIVLLTVALSVTLVGCTGSKSLLNIPGISSASSTPTVGQCWEVDYDSAQNDASWEGSAAVTCTQPHQAYTYAVVKIESNEKSWKTSDGTEDTVISNAAYQACEDKSDALMSKTDSYMRVLQHYFYLPSETEWKAGARWVRCDIGLIKLGSYYDQPDLGDLPAFGAILSEIKTDPTRLMTCVNTTDSTGGKGPLDDNDAVYADCSQNPQWIMHSDVNLATSGTEEYPGDDAINQAATDQCDTPATAAGVKSLAYIPNAQNWSDGDTFLECWFYGSSASVGANGA